MMSDKNASSESWNVAGNAQKNIFEGNTAPIIKDTSGNVTINYANRESFLSGNPFKPPLPREGGLFGRKEDLERLHNLLQSGRNVCLVSGMGGVGKTELARFYAASEDCKTLFPGGVFYIDVRSGKDLAADLVVLTKYHFKGEIQHDLSPQQKLMACWDVWKRQTDKVLLILDDLSGLGKNVRQYLPPSDLVTVRLLMTSRETPDKPIPQELKLEVLLPSAARELLSSIIGRQRVDAELQETDKLCEELGYLPLALELVGYYLDDEDYQELSLSAMRVKLKEKVQHPSLSPEDVPMGMKATRGVQAAFDLSWDELTPQAKHLACVLGAFGDAAIHWGLVTAIYKILQGESFSEDNLKDRWLKSLRKLHLVRTVKTDIYNLHPLIRDYLGEQLKKHCQYSEIKQAFCDVFSNVARKVDQSIALETFNLIEPHLKKMIAWCEGNQDTQLAFSLNQLALLYYSQGRYEQAEPLYKQALELRKRLLGDNHPDVASSLNNLAGLYYSQGRYEQAEPLYKQALELRKRLLGDNHPDVASSLNNLAGLYSSQGRYEEAEPLYKQALELRKRLLGDNHPDVASSLNNLAGLYSSQGRYEEAEPLYKQALELRKRLLGDNHPNVATSLNNLAGLYDSQGRYEEAEPLYKQALELSKRLLGDNHPDVATSLNNLAGLYSSQGRYEQAEPLYKQALELSKRLLGDNHPDVATSLNNLAALYDSQGRYEEAEPLYKQALELSKRLLGDNHPNVATSLNNLAALYDSQGRYEEAEPLYKQALELIKRLLGDNHPDVATSLNNLAALYDSQGRYEEAEPLYKQALELRKRLLGDNHPNVASSLNNLAGLYDSQGRYEEAEPLYKQALELSKRLLGDNHPNVATSLNNLAGLYSSQGRYEEAEPLYKQALELRKRLLGDNHPNVATSLNNLAGLYYSQGRYEQAEPLYKQALQICEQTLGVAHPNSITIGGNYAQCLRRGR
ncbi:tetratricopeptide repeat protein [Gloeothece verrucosa]|uniref:TPR repeat-containing protein n=1 Tax=Gloeothece verrucosa (strain PCC 7822) TaxID=497965 RepID=E0UKE4_GLOV7|nr:tetratricopeptide repeat protein [Gloeothece verrucosa]ADN17025.1 TPR repeat-containing protein [Gloeothece verrucosa PCC 7822]